MTMILFSHLIEVKTSTAPTFVSDIRAIRAFGLKVLKGYKIIHNHIFYQLEKKILVVCKITDFF